MLLISAYRFPAELAATLAVIPWAGWSGRFSLTTLLIATTTIAVVLGLIAQMMRTVPSIVPRATIMPHPFPLEHLALTRRELLAPLRHGLRRPRARRT